MSRSDNVYVVQAIDDAWNRDLVVIAAFTVKHELATWLYRRHNKWVTVTRVEDGPVGGDGSKITELPIEPLIQQGYEHELHWWKRTMPDYRGEEPQPWNGVK